MKTITVTGSSPLDEALGEDGDEDLEWYTRERDPAFIATIAEARQQVAKGKTVGHQELKAMLDRK